MDSLPLKFIKLRNNLTVDLSFSKTLRYRYHYPYRNRYGFRNSFRYR